MITQAILQKRAALFATIIFMLGRLIQAKLIMR